MEINKHITVLEGRNMYSVKFNFTPVINVAKVMGKNMSQEEVITEGIKMQLNNILNENDLVVLHSSELKSLRKEIDLLNERISQKETTINYLEHKIAYE